MAIPEAIDAVEWDVQFDRKFHEQFEALRNSGRDGPLRNRITKIIHNPLSGEAKTGVLKGTRTTHAKQLIIQWELQPEIHNRAHLDELQRLYFLHICHHDEMENLGKRGPVETTDPTFRVEFETLDIAAVVSAIHAADYTSNVEAEWGSSHVTVRGTVAEEDSDRLRCLIPSSAELEIYKDSPL